MRLIGIALVVALLGPLQLGISLVLLNAMLKPLYTDLGFDKNVGGGVAAAVMYLGVAVGGLAAGPLEDASGKYAQVWMGALYTLGNLLCAFSTDHKLCWGGSFDGCVADMILTGRLITGLASGLALVVSPRFLAEVSPPNIRGALTACYQFMTGIGAFAGLLIGLPYEFDSEFKAGYAWWRIMFLLVAAIGVLHVTLAFVTFPLYKKSRQELRRSLTAEEFISDEGTLESEETKRLILTNDRIHHDSTRNNQLPEEESVGEQWMQTLRLITQKRYRRSWFLGIGVPVFGRLCGIDALSAYSTMVFEDAGFEHPVIGSILFGFVDFVASAIPVFLFDWLGRVRSAEISFVGVTISHMGLAVSGLLKAPISGWLSVVSVLLFMFLYPCAGSLNKTYAPEVVPSEVARVILGTGQCMAALSALGSVVVFPSLLDALGASLYFFLHGSFVFASLLILRIFMIETKGRELDDVRAEVLGSN